LPVWLGVSVTSGADVNSMRGAWWSGSCSST
jgi:hypothetical protein